MKQSKQMTQENQTLVTELILLGFSDLSLPWQHFLFSLFLILYTLTLLGNMIIFVILTVDPGLHTPMYFFLRNLSVVEICFISTTVPKMLVNLLIENRSISILGCATQMYFFIFFGVNECLFLAAMAYDRYVAICNPLHYTMVMTKEKCVTLAGVLWVIGMVFSAGRTSFIFTVPLCRTNVINHFFCDIQPVLRLACIDTFINGQVTLLSGVLLVLLPFLLIVISYIYILSSIRKISSSEGREKAFSTCTAHLTSVTLFYGTALLTYLKPRSGYSAERERLFALFYAVIMPMLNPMIYSLRNKEVKKALRRRIWGKMVLFCEGLCSSTNVFFNSRSRTLY
ncbi:olfactory receptor 10A4-like [Microcaecilia unicolor]|uniref:Olfactory receptor 10A4-like n=1 Tax=Microcaecilia unicolor TaxID=1415580 RepID=A0A6P7WX21_9AMPH|nr:olfactory receptor 10A4-like [Microcaecilia unicolor]